MDDLEEQQYVLIDKPSLENTQPSSYFLNYFKGDNMAHNHTFAIGGDIVSNFVPENKVILPNK